MRQHRIADRVAPGEAVEVDVTYRLPFWWRPYFWALVAFHNSGLVRADPEIAAAFLVRHGKAKVTPCHD